jgi:hypothetical protein
VADGSLLAGDFKAGQLPAGPAGERGPQGLPGAQGLKGDTGTQGAQGLQGSKGDPCLPSDPNCKGPKGDTGAQGPGTQTFEGQFIVDGLGHNIATINGIVLTIRCNSGDVAVFAQRLNENYNLFGWGFQAVDGSVSIATTQTDAHQGGVYIGALATSNVQIDVDVRSATVGVTPLTHIDILGIRGNACNYHALVIPSS